MQDDDNPLAPLYEPGHVRAYDLTTVAEALGLSHKTVKGWANRNEIRTVQASPGCKRYVQLDEVERLEAEGWSVDVDVLLDAD